MKACIIMLLGIVTPSVAAAQTFPPDSQWVPFHCGAAVMTDAYRDTTGFFNELDVVGDANTPAGYHAFDAQFLYLRLRLDADPAPAQNPLPSSWGFAFDTDDVL